MFQTPDPAFAAFIEALISRPTSVETFVVSNGENEAVRLVVTLGEITIAIDVEVHLSPDPKGESYLDPFLTPETLSALITQCVILDDPLVAIEEGLQIAYALTTAHRTLIVKTAREQFAQHAV